ncbi:Hsp20/alpha crystallin family protein [bacterium]|uniref:SHSP domain-containing protein n=2 Tax=Katanobacteria TaxID=422282 RepID=A0A2M7X560_UNCKA|nr:Hsp20/alpha crystallin family protein [bacterium]PIP56272.1 MAG: hypothetical protein COX05_04000 [candidate division WWE3 bacterium CG22_combo_CG10-13_8_21_14_all_39_12]PJA41267.1 MAG: hypothetical protein CO179_00285 [candidate division WWE3 bacterium CG_4_9_14_3_um_filter_39_7]
MTRIVRWDPFQEFRSAMLSPNTFGGFLDDEGEGMLRINLSEDDTSIKIETDLPGVNLDDVDIDVSTDSVTIHAKREETEEEKSREYIRRERRYGSYARTISLPSQVVPEKAEATFTDGTLVLTVEKLPESSSNQVKVKVNRS